MLSALLLVLFLLAGSAAFWLYRRRRVPAIMPPDRSVPYSPLEEDEAEIAALHRGLHRGRAALRARDAATAGEIGDQIDALEERLNELKARLESWKPSLIDADELRLRLDLLRQESALRAAALERAANENETLRAALDEARREALADWEEREELRRRIALLHSLSDGDSPSEQE